MAEKTAPSKTHLVMSISTLVCAAFFGISGLLTHSTFDLAVSILLLVVIR